jgi:hypothetical protein
MQDGVDSTSSSSFSSLVTLTQLRTCVWRLINLELFHSLYAAGSSRHPGTNAATVSIDPALESVLLAFAQSSSSPHPYIDFLQSYCRTSEQTALHRQCVEQLQQYTLDLALVQSPPSISAREDGAQSPLYNCDLLTKLLQLDLDVAFELEAARMQQAYVKRQQQEQDHSRMDADDTTSTALVLRDSTADAASQRQRIEQLILSLRRVNNTVLLADCELQQLKSFRRFVQICLQRQPSLLGIKPKSGLAFELIEQSAKLLRDASGRAGDGEVMGLFVAELTTLLLAFVSSALAVGASGEESGVAGPPPLTAAILVHLSRTQHRNQLPDVDDTAAGESVFRATNELLSSLATSLQAVLHAFAPSNPALLPNKQSSDGGGIVPMLSAAAVPVTASTSPRLFSFDATARLSNGWYALRVAVASAVSNVVPVLSVRSAPLAVVQNLSSACLLLTRWANQLLLIHLAPPQQQSNNSNTVSSPAVTGAAGPTRGGAAGGFALKPVLEARKSLTNRHLISAIGDEYATTCQTLMQGAATCLAQPLLADTAVTIVPLLLQAIDVVQGVTKRSSLDAFTPPQDEMPIDRALAQLRPLLPSLLHAFVSMPVGQPALAHKLVQLFASWPNTAAVRKCSCNRR